MFMCMAVTKGNLETQEQKTKTKQNNNNESIYYWACMENLLTYFWEEDRFTSAHSPSELWLLAIWKRSLRSKFFLFQTLRYWLIPRNLPYQVSRVFSPCQTVSELFGPLGSFTAVTGVRCPFREKHSWSYLACEALDYQLVCVFLMVLCSQQSSKCCWEIFRFLRLTACLPRHFLPSFWASFFTSVTYILFLHICFILLRASVLSSTCSPLSLVDGNKQCRNPSDR